MRRILFLDYLPSELEQTGSGLTVRPCGFFVAPKPGHGRKMGFLSHSASDEGNFVKSSLR